MAGAEVGTAGRGRTPLDLPLNDGGMTFIEASAGTGKTHALTTLVARLVIEEDWPLDRILVVTFTRAATAELRDRIRRVLGAVLAAVRGREPADRRSAPVPEPEAREPEDQTEIPATHRSESGDSTESGLSADPRDHENDPQALELLEAWAHRGGSIDSALARRLEGAMRDIDRANVHTIHGFCQRVLADLAFESGFPFGFEVSDGGEMVGAAVRDCWRRRLYPASTLVLRHALASDFMPDALAAWVSERRAKTGVSIIGGDPLPEPIEVHEAAWREVYEAARVEWAEHRDSFLSEIRQGGWLNRGRYRSKRTEQELAAMEVLFDASDPWLPEEGAAGRYGREQLSQACKRNFELPDNPLFDTLDRLERASGELRSACDRWLRWTRREILFEVRKSVRRRVRDDRRLAYDDLLIELEEALDGAGGSRLAARIRLEYPCALVDEYQDTDPVQARIFGRVYGEAPVGPAGEGRANRSGAAGTANAVRDAGRSAPESDGSSATSGRDHERRPATPASADRGAHDGVGSAAPGGSARSGVFIVVGDPKQSIYRFRGADVFAYLAVQRTARERLHLGRNWRSIPALVESVNEVFAGATPFVTGEIEYRPVSAARDGGDPLLSASGERGKPFQLWLLPRRENDRLLAKRDVIPAVAGAAADEIARLLEIGARSEAAIGGEPLTGADIAVLVRTKEQGRLVTGALHERGVPSIQIDDGSVFDTREAEQIERLLWAIATPGRETMARGALAGDVFGLDARALLALGDEEDVWSGWAARLADWRAHWESRGIGSVLLRLLEAEGGAAHLLAHRDGARRLTNFRHVAELLQQAETRERFAPAELVAWLNRRRAESGGRDDATQLRLESDEQLVKVLTVHGAKGLEFPVVFYPFAWDARSPRRRPGATDAAYHLGPAEGFREVLDLDPDERAESIERLEEFSESVRLLYVALTRAKYRCVVTWGQVRGAEHSPLAWLLHRRAGGTAETQPRGAPANGTGTEEPDAAAGTLAGVATRFAALSAREWLDEVHTLVRRLPDAISATVLDPEPRPARMLAPCDDVRPALAARQLHRPLRRVRTLTSFSALSAQLHPAAGDTARSPVGRDVADLDRPDHDQREEPPDASVDETGTAGGRAGRERSAFTFPRGPVAGSCLHRIFERVDMRSELEPENIALEEITRDALEEFGIGGDWGSVANDMVERTRAVDLLASGGFRLGDSSRRLVELEFHFPVGGLDRDRLCAVLAEHGYPTPFARAGTDESGEPPVPIHGFLRGFIDLVVEHAGRWYVVDYKSNWLGPEPDDYGPEALADAMRAGGYTLQSLIYLVALHRYLAVRLPDYDCEHHVGGAFYLFVRGIDPAAGTRRGVHFDKPSTACLRALDDCFRGSGP